MSPMVQNPAELLFWVADHDAMHQAVRAANGAITTENARGLVQRALASRQPSETVPEYVVGAAMHHFVGSQMTEPVVGVPIPVERHLEEALGLAWAAWARGDVEETQRLIGKVEPVLQRRQHASGMTLMGLGLWCRAIRLLLAGMRDESRKLWSRAVEVGSTFGLEATDMMRWTFAATFRP